MLENNTAIQLLDNYVKKYNLTYAKLKNQERACVSEVGANYYNVQTSIYKEILMDLEALKKIAMEISPKNLSQIHISLDKNCIFNREIESLKAKALVLNQSLAPSSLMMRGIDVIEDESLSKDQLMLCYADDTKEKLIFSEGKLYKISLSNLKEKKDMADNIDRIVDLPKEDLGKRERLIEKFAQVINQESLENQSNTPDFILAEYLVSCLEAFNRASTSRETWYGKKLEPGKD
jgi:hypothetical protein